MQLTLNHIQHLDTDAQWFNLTEQEIEEAKLTHSQYSNDFAKHNAQLNSLCLTKVSAYLKDNLAETIQLFPSQADSLQLWEFINGTVLTIGETKLIIIPSEDEDTDEISVPQEWIDIPNFAADYYLAVQINLDEKWLRIWGLTNHLTLKQAGDYDPIDHYYRLEKEQIVTDLETLGLAREMSRQERATLQPLTKLSPTLLESSLEKLTQVYVYSPRLDIPFLEWSNILTDNILRQTLYQKRTQSFLKKVPEKVQNTVNNLTQWLKEDFNEAIEMGWQTFDHLFSQSLPYRELAYRKSGDKKDINREINRTKLLKLKGQVGEITVALSVVIIPEENDTIGVYLELHPDPQERYLPPNLKLLIIEESNILETITAQQQDILLQSDYYSCTKGTEFQVQIILNPTVQPLLETFTIL